MLLLLKVLNIIQDISQVDKVRLDLLERFSDLSFDEETHTYTLPDGMKLISSTTWIKRFQEKFEDYYIANKVAESVNNKVSKSKKRGYGYYLNRWKQQREAATLSGSRVHEYIEYNYPDFVDDPACQQEYGAILFFNDLDPKYKVVCMELRMYIKEFHKAGTADCILYNTETGNIIIADWKTNDTNLHQYYSNKHLKQPFQHLYDTDLNKYSLQLSDYHNMIEMNTDYKVEDRWIVHLTTSNYNNLDFSKQNKSDRYSIDYSLLPIREEEYYKLYSLPDYSKVLKEEYTNG